MKDKEPITKESLQKEVRNQLYQVILMEVINNAKDNKPLDFTEVELLRNIDRASLNDKDALIEFRALAKDYIKEYSVLSDHGLVKKHINHVISIIDDLIAVK